MRIIGWLVVGNVVLTVAASACAFGLDVGFADWVVRCECGLYLVSKEINEVGKGGLVGF